MARNPARGRLVEPATAAPAARVLPAVVATPVALDSGTPVASQPLDQTVGQATDPTTASTAPHPGRDVTAGDTTDQEDHGLHGGLVSGHALYAVAGPADHHALDHDHLTGH